MPLVTVRLFAERLTADTERQLIERLSAAVTQTFGPDALEQTWVVLEPVDRWRWGIAGRPCGTRPDDGDGR